MAEGAAAGPRAAGPERLSAAEIERLLVAAEGLSTAEMQAFAPDRDAAERLPVAREALRSSLRLLAVRLRLLRLKRFGEAEAARPPIGFALDDSDLGHLPGPVRAVAETIAALYARLRRLGTPEAEIPPPTPSPARSLFQLLERAF